MRYVTGDKFSRVTRVFGDFSIYRARIENTYSHGPGLLSIFLGSLNLKKEKLPFIFHAIVD
jgi:hypothetical protein